MAAYEQRDECSSPCFSLYQLLPFSGAAASTCRKRFNHQSAFHVDGLHGESCGFLTRIWYVHYFSDIIVTGGQHSNAKLFRPGSDKIIRIHVQRFLSPN